MVRHLQKPHAFFINYMLTRTDDKQSTEKACKDKNLPVMG
jgi:hypothetical protein